MVKFQPSKLAMWVRFPLPAPNTKPVIEKSRIMKAIIRSRSTRVLVFSSLLLIASIAQGAEPSACAEIANDVRSAVEKDPAKVLMVVEDALVINEACACEIVKAAITASKADPALVQQIVQTAIAVAPKMSAIITECAGTSSGVTVTSAESDTDGGKNPKNPKNPTNPKAPVTASVERDPLGAGGSTEGDYITSARSIFLVNQPAAIINNQSYDKDDDGDDDDKGDDDTENRANSRRSRNLVPLSPAFAVVP